MSLTHNTESRLLAVRALAILSLWLLIALVR